VRPTAGACVASGHPAGSGTACICAGRQGCRLLVLAMPRIPVAPVLCGRLRPQTSVALFCQGGPHNPACTCFAAWAGLPGRGLHDDERRDCAWQPGMRRPHVHRHTSGTAGAERTRAAAHANAACLSTSGKLLTEKVDVMRLTFYIAPITAVFILPILLHLEVRAARGPNPSRRTAAASRACVCQWRRAAVLTDRHSVQTRASVCPSRATG